MKHPRKWTNWMRIHYKIIKKDTCLYYKKKKTTTRRKHQSCSMQIASCSFLTIRMTPAGHNKPSSTLNLQNEVTCIVQLVQAAFVMVRGLLSKPWGQFRSSPAQRNIQFSPISCVHIEPATLLTIIQGVKAQCYIYPSPIIPVNADTPPPSCLHILSTPHGTDLSPASDWQMSMYLLSQCLCISNLRGQLVLWTYIILCGNC